MPSRSSRSSRPRRRFAPRPYLPCLGPCDCPKVVIFSPYKTENGIRIYPPPPLKVWPLKMLLCHVRRAGPVQIPLFLPRRRPNR